jgi:hypothetical protein
MFGYRYRCRVKFPDCEITMKRTVRLGIGLSGVLARLIDLLKLVW